VPTTTDAGAVSSLFFGWPTTVADTLSAVTAMLPT